jgi:hypothetical protein
MFPVTLGAVGAPLGLREENMAEEHEKEKSSGKKTPGKKPKGKKTGGEEPDAEELEAEEPKDEKPQSEHPQGEEPQGKSEIMRNAQMLVKSKGAEAAKYSKDMLESMRNAGDEHDIAFWEKIAAQVELLVESLPED